MLNTMTSQFYEWLSSSMKKACSDHWLFGSHVKICCVITVSMFQIIAFNYTYWTGSRTLTFERQNGRALTFFENIVDYSGLYIFIVPFAVALNFIYMYRMWP